MAIKPFIKPAPPPPDPPIPREEGEDDWSYFKRCKPPKPGQSMDSWLTDVAHDEAVNPLMAYWPCVDPILPKRVDGTCEVEYFGHTIYMKLPPGDAIKKRCELLNYLMAYRVAFEDKRWQLANPGKVREPAKYDPTKIGYELQHKMAWHVLMQHLGITSRFSASINHRQFETNLVCPQMKGFVWGRQNLYEGKKPWWNLLINKRLANNNRDMAVGCNALGSLITAETTGDHEGPSYGWQWYQAIVHAELSSGMLIVRGWVHPEDLIDSKTQVRDGGKAEQFVFPVADLRPIRELLENLHGWDLERYRREKLMMVKC